MQTTNYLLMVRPSRFSFNEETAATNAFQQRSQTIEEALRIQHQAVEEFDAYVALLRDNGIKVDVHQDTPNPFTPDSIFPNNCFSTHLIGTERVLVVYPMFAPNRRLERDKLFSHEDYTQYDRVIDLTHWEQEDKFLEGTGSLILDRDHHIAYACRSPRTNESVLRDWAGQLGYKYFLFDSKDENGMAVYHTNVVMHVGTRFAVVCMDTIKDINQRRQLSDLLTSNGKEVVEITLEQMHNFAGNMLEVRNDKGQKLLIMSAAAKRSLTEMQIALLEQDVKILAPSLDAIETVGGGSARCMIAEIFDSN